MEINVGDYIRIKNGGIHKVCQIDDTKTVWKYLCDKTSCGDGTFELIPFKEELIKDHSKDITDLVEVGDAVVVDDIKYTVITFLKNGNDDIVLKGICKDRIYLTLGEVKIKQILTHEQFEANAYDLEKER